MNVVFFYVNEQLLKTNENAVKYEQFSCRVVFVLM